MTIPSTSLFVVPDYYYPAHNYLPVALAVHHNYYHQLHKPLANLYQLCTDI
jgi:hypothetical protein